MKKEKKEKMSKEGKGQEIINLMGLKWDPKREKIKLKAIARAFERTKNREREGSSGFT